MKFVRRFIEFMSTSESVLGFIVFKKFILNGIIAYICYLYVYVSVAVAVCLYEYIYREREWNGSRQSLNWMRYQKVYQKKKPMKINGSIRCDKSSSEEMKKEEEIENQMHISFENFLKKTRHLFQLHRAAVTRHIPPLAVKVF